MVCAISCTITPSEAAFSPASVVMPPPAPP